MADTPGSFSKNFSWHKSFRRLHGALAGGFAHELKPTPRWLWRERSGLNDRNLELIPLNFFLHSIRGVREDFAMADTLVETAIVEPYNKEFARLALFAFHLADSGCWHGSKWVDGRVAGWANEFVTEIAWRNGKWRPEAFEDRAMTEFIEKNVNGEPITKRKMLTNYRYMLVSAGLLADQQLVPIALGERWLIRAVQLFWDRQLFRGFISNNGEALERCFLESKLYRLFGCSECEARPIVLTAAREYCGDRMHQRLNQMETIREVIFSAA